MSVGGKMLNLDTGPLKVVTTMPHPYGEFHYRHTQ